MRVISIKKLRQFWEAPGNRESEVPLRAWFRTVKLADWQNFSDVKAVYNTADLVKKSRHVVFDIGGNKFRLVAVIDYARHKVFVRFVLNHEEYDRGNWRKDVFGEDRDKAADERPPASKKKRRPREK